MSETRSHLAGVAALEHFVRIRAGDRGDLVVYRDTPDAEPQRKPPLVGGFRPDLFARTWKDGAFVIGEAKTAHDIHTVHSRAQVGAFLDVVRRDQLGMLVLSIPFAVTASARALLDALSTDDDPVRERVHFISPETVLVAVRGECVA